VGTHVHEGGRKGSPLRGEPAVRILDLAGIVANKNTIPGDTQTSLAMGIRLGTPWLTQRGFGPAEMDQVAGLIHKTVAAIRPFSYMGLAGELPRGKVDLDTFEEIKADVAALAAKGAAETEDRGTGYPHYYVLGDPKGFQKPFGSGPGLEAELKAAHEAAVVMAPPGGLLLVTGERAEAALAQIVTSDVAGLAPGRTQSGFILDKDGVVLDDVFVMRLPPDERGRDRFFLRTHVENHARVAAWLRGLGDGYTLFDPADLFAKVEGPIIVEDVSHSQTFEVSETSKVFKPHIQISEVSETSKVFKPHIQTFEVSETSKVFIPHIQTFEVSETSKVFIPLIVHGPAGLATVHAANLSGIHVFAGGHGHAELIVPAAQAQTVYDRLVAAGATPAGEETFAALRRRSGLPDYSQFRGFGPGSDRPTGLDLHRVAPHRFELRKPYFVGQHILAHLRAAQSTALPIYQSTNPQSTNPPTHRTPLYAWHKAHTRHIVPFAGWEMPVWYTGVLDEHNAVRKRAGLFDVAHMGVFEVSGPHAVEFLDLVCTNYVRWYAAGESFYTYLLDPDGKVIDDLLVYRRRADLFQIVVNAANADKDWAWLNAVNNGEALLDRGRPDLRVLRPATIRNLKDPASGADMRVDLALQGPASLRILQSLADDPRLADRLGRVRKTGLIECTLSGPSTGSGRGFDLIIARTGYTGEEIGYEIFVHPDRAVALWERLLEAGKPFGIQPTALAARDSTRTEAGLPLYGHELAGPFDISPAGAGFPGYVKLHKPYFIGRAAYIAAESQRTMEIARFRMNERGVRMPKTGDPVVNRRGQAIGWVASAAVDVDGLILGLAYIQSRYHKQGDQIGVFALPAKPLVEKANKADLAPGDKVSLPDAATLLRRFPDKAERAHWRGGPSAGALAAPPVSE
jgi:glycine cleavage system T protein